MSRDIPVGPEPHRPLDAFLAEVDRLTLAQCRTTKVIYADGSGLLIQRWSNGLCSAAVREHGSDTWSPPVPVTVKDTVDPEGPSRRSGSLSVNAEAGVE